MDQSVPFISQENLGVAKTVTQLARQMGQKVFTIGSRHSKGLTFVATLDAETHKTLAGAADACISLDKQLGITEYTLTGPDELVHEQRQGNNPSSSSLNLAKDY